MVQLRRELDLAQEPLGPEVERQRRAEHLEGDRPVVPEVPGEVDGGHAPAPELALDQVALRNARLAHMRNI